MDIKNLIYVFNISKAFFRDRNMVNIKNKTKPKFISYKASKQQPHNHLEKKESSY